jgi:amidase
VDARVTATIDAQRATFESLGCIIEEAHPDMRDADEVFKVWRAWEFEASRGDLVAAHPEMVKETVRWNVEMGRYITGPQLARVELKRTELYHRVREFMQTYEFLILPVSQVPPFDVKQRWVTEIAGQTMETYVDWMKSCYFISVLGLPAISVPCGSTPEGLPVGVQIVGRHQDEFGVLQLAYAFQQATGFWKQRPAVAI